MSILSMVIKEHFGNGLRKPSPHPLQRYVKLHEFIERRMSEDIYPEYPDPLHTRVTHEVLDRINAKWALRGKHVLDIGCGQGVALETFAEYGAIAKGLTFGEDFEECRRKGYDVYQMDMSFLEFQDETFDLIWARHVLEHSLFPYFTLNVLFSALKHGGLLYVEVPAADTNANHQLNKNHYSCLTQSSWRSLFDRVGFATVQAFDIHVALLCGPEIWYSYDLQRP